MEINQEKLDEITLALLFLNSFQEGPVHRAWKGLNWDALDRLFQKGLISDPKNKNKSVVLSEDGQARGKELFDKHFGIK